MSQEKFMENIREIIDYSDQIWSNLSSKAIWQAITDLISVLGSTDSEFRESIGGTLAKVVEKYLTNEQRSTLIPIITTENHLFFGLNKEYYDPDTIFKRSFSILIIVFVVYRHRNKPFLDLKQPRLILEIMNSYTGQENDWRGYVLEKGWAHTGAHCADLLDELANCQEIDRTDATKILNIIEKIVLKSDQPFIFEEDDRLAYAATNVIKRKLLTQDEINAWIDALQPKNPYENSANDHLSWIKYTNTKSFIRSLYVQMKNTEFNLHVF